MLKRFVTYIYQYDRGNRGQNVGFVKTDIRDAGCRMELQLRIPDRFQGKGRVYLIVSGEKAIGIPAGEISIHQGLGQLKLAYARNFLGSSGYSVSQIQAVAILYGSGSLLLSCWSEQVSKPVLLGKFDIFGESPQAEKETSSTRSDTAADTDRTADEASESSEYTDSTQPADSSDTQIDTPADDPPQPTQDTGSLSADRPQPTPDTAPSAVDRQNTDTFISSPEPDGRNTNPFIGIPNMDTRNTQISIPTTDRPQSDMNSSARAALSPMPFLTDSAERPDSVEEEAMPTVGIADAPTAPDETLVDFGVTSEEISATELQAPQPGIPELQPADTVNLRNSTDTTETQDAINPLQTDNVEEASAVHSSEASCPCQNQRGPETHTQAKPAPEPEPPVTTYQKIAITDIRSSLPKRNWYLCSNSFLIHGFFNYHYLILKTVEYNGQKKYYLGVPGVYEQPERTMAFMFGFPSFEPAHSEEETAQNSNAAGLPSTAYETGVFGYWMLPLMDES